LSISSESVQLPSPDVIVIGPWKERGKRTVILPSFVKTFRENGLMVSMACCKHGIDYCQHSSRGAQGESHHFRRDRPIVGADTQQRSLSRALRAPILMSHEPYIDVHTACANTGSSSLPPLPVVRQPRALLCIPSRCQQGLPLLLEQGGDEKTGRRYMFP